MKRHTHLSRNIKKSFFFLKEKISFTFSHLSPGGKISLIGNAIIGFSILLPWASMNNQQSGGEKDIFGIWSNVLGSPGVFIILTWICILFSLLSLKQKEKIRFLTFIYLSDSFTGIIGGIFIFCITLHTSIVISGLGFFSSQVSHEKGIILCATGSILVGVGSYILRNEQKKNIKGSYVHEYENQSRFEKNNSDEKNNMKLPF